MTIYAAELETRHFTFTAYGLTEYQAWNALRRAWAVHRLQYSNPTSTLARWSELKDNVTIRARDIGAAYRDHELLADVEVKIDPTDVLSRALSVLEEDEHFDENAELIAEMRKLVKGGAR
jgi:hypothetical protein